MNRKKKRLYLALSILLCVCFCISLYYTLIAITTICPLINKIALIAITVIIFNLLDITSKHYIYYGD